MCEFKIEVDFVVDMMVYNLFDFFVEEVVEEWLFSYLDELWEDLEIYCWVELVGLLFKVFLEFILRDKKWMIDFVVEFNVKVVDDVGYVICMELGV